jgi:hypothetical protein
MRLSGSLLESLHLHEDSEFKGFATSDESWVYYQYQEISKYAFE